MRSRVLCVSMAIYHHAAAEEVSHLMTHQLPFHPNEQALNGQKKGDWESVQPPAPVDLDDDTNNNNNGKGKRAREYPEPLFTLRRLTGPTGRSSYEFRQHLSVLLARPPTPQPLKLCTPGGRRLFFLARTDPILLVLVIFPCPRVKHLFCAHFAGFRGDTGRGFNRGICRVTCRAYVSSQTLPKVSDAVAWPQSRACPIHSKLANSSLHARERLRAAGVHGICTVAGLLGEQGQFNFSKPLFT